MVSRAIGRKGGYTQQVTRPFLHWLVIQLW